MHKVCLYHLIYGMLIFSCRTGPGQTKDLMSISASPQSAPNSTCSKHVRYQLAMMCTYLHAAQI